MCAFFPAAGHKTLVPELVAELKKQGAEHILVIAGGVIPAQVRSHAFPNVYV